MFPYRQIQASIISQQIIFIILYYSVTINSSCHLNLRLVTLSKCITFHPNKCYLLNDSFQLTLESKDVWTNRYTMWFTRPHYSSQAEIIFICFLILFQFCIGRGWKQKNGKMSGIGMHDTKSTINKIVLKSFEIKKVTGSFDYHLELIEEDNYLHLLVHSMN